MMISPCAVRSKRRSGLALQNSKYSSSLIRNSGLNVSLAGSACSGKTTCIPHSLADSKSARTQACGAVGTLECSFDLHRHAAADFVEEVDHQFYVTLDLSRLRALRGHQHGQAPAVGGAIESHSHAQVRQPP